MSNNCPCDFTPSFVHTSPGFAGKAQKKLLTKVPQTHIPGF